MPDLLEALVAKVEPLDLALLVTDWLRTPPLARRCSMAQAHKAYVAHHIPGHRVRIRVPHKKRDQAFFHDVNTKLNAIEGVKASVRAETGSVLVHYQGDLSDLLLKAVEAGLDALLDLQMEPEPVEPLGNRLISQSVAFEKTLLESTGGRVDGRSFALLTLLVAAGFQIFRGQLFGPAVPLLWYTAELIRNYLPRPSHQG